MKKVFAILLMAVAVMIVFVSCDEAKHEHSYGTEWKYDENNHWHECECKEKKDVAAHKYGEWKASKEEGKVERTCSVCDYVEKADTVLVGTKGELSTAIAAGVETIVLDNDITDLNEKLQIKRSLTLEMNGHSITANASKDTYADENNAFCIFKVNASDVSFEIKNSSDTESVIKVDGEAFTRAMDIAEKLLNVNVTINKGVTFNTTQGVVIKSGTLNLYGTIDVTGREFAISGDATQGFEATDPGTIINLYEGATVKSTAQVSGYTGCAAIYHPQKGILNIKGATVEGYTGICIRSGELNISGNATIKGIVNDTVLNSGNNKEPGARYDGSAIVICSSSSSYHGNMKISITDSTIESTYSYAIREIYTSSDSSTKLTSLKIDGSSSVIKSGSSITYDLNLLDKTKVEITGGTFSKDPSTYVKTGYKAEKSGDVWVVKADTTT